MSQTRECTLFRQYLTEKKLKLTGQRQAILKIFLATETHFSVEELYYLIKKHYPNIGYTTVYRTLKLLKDCGLANEIKFSDGIARYEHLFGHAHHDHLICTECGKLIEVVDSEIEALQNKLAQKHHFTVTDHHMEIYGQCPDCQNQK